MHMTNIEEETNLVPKKNYLIIMLLISKIRKNLSKFLKFLGFYLSF